MHEIHTEAHGFHYGIRLKLIPVTVGTIAYFATSIVHSKLDYCDSSYYDLFNYIDSLTLFKAIFSLLLLLANWLDLSASASEAIAPWLSTNRVLLFYYYKLKKLCFFAWQNKQIDQKTSSGHKKPLTIALL